MAERFEFSDALLQERFVDHWGLADKYRQRLEKEFDIKTELSVRRLYLTIISAYKDIERYKNFHQDDPHTQRSDAVKRASYLAKWLCRLKPLSICESDDGKFDLFNTAIDKTTLINELFALFLATVHLSVDVKRDFLIGPDKAYEIAYEMLFRHLSEDSYMLVFQMLVDHIKEEKEIAIFL